MCVGQVSVCFLIWGLRQDLLSGSTAALKRRNPAGLRHAVDQRVVGSDPYQPQYLRLGHQWNPVSAGRKNAKTDY